ncbi:MAG: GlsB/YeaQ/YmgE family stress response membrane protein [Myxococcota bacterium]
MGILSWIVFGFIVGLLARAVMPGSQAMGVVMTTLLGVAGSFLGGFVASALTGESPTVFHPAGVIGSILGAIALLFIAGAVFTRGGRTGRFAGGTRA